MTARALLVSHRGLRCGVHHFGSRLFDALARSGKLEWSYAEVGDADEFGETLATEPAELIVFNYHPRTLPFLTREVLTGVRVTTFGIMHEASQETVDCLDDMLFDYLLCPDPTLIPRDPRILPVPRFGPDPIAEQPALPEVFTVGSFGFGTPGKGFGRLCRVVNEEFDIARVRINIPPHDNPAIVPKLMLNAILAECHSAITKPGIDLEITHEFFDDLSLLQFLAANTINVFLYDQQNGRGVSSCTDHALAARRPIGISDSDMFRNLLVLNPTIVATRRPLRAIAADGFAPLSHILDSMTPGRSGAVWDAAIREALARQSEARLVPDGRGLNKLLDDRSRAAYTVAEQQLRELSPDVIARKIPRANIQQAFAFDTAHQFLARMHEAKILAVGSFEDTAVAALQAEGYLIDEVDPGVNGLDLADYYLANPEAGGGYDLVLCVSVLEHVADDETFVRMVGDLLAPGGIAIFTVDFSESFPLTRMAPAMDKRLYTRTDIRQRLMGMLPDCALVDPETWLDGTDDFEYENIRYAFATWVFRKRPLVSGSSSRAAVPAWSHFLAGERRLREQAVAAQTLAIRRIEATEASAALQLAKIEARSQENLAAAEFRVAAAVTEQDAIRAAAEFRVAASMMELDAIRASTSWRITRPLRGLRRLARMFRRGGI